MHALKKQRWSPPRERRDPCAPAQGYETIRCFLPSLIAVAFVVLTFAAPTRADTFADALAAKEAGDYPRAIALLEATIAREPVNVDALFHLATVLGWSGRYTESIALFERALALEPRNDDLRLGYARVLAWSGRPDDATRVLQTVLAGQPQHVEAAVTLGRVQTWRRDFVAAETTYRAVLARNPNQPDALIGLGDLRRAQERYPEARAYYRQAGQIAPQAPELQGKLASLRGLGHWRLDAGVEFSTFAGDTRSDWRGAAAVLRAAIDRRTGVALGTEWADRFDREDEQYSVALDHRLNDQLWAYTRLSATPDAEFWARRTLAIGGEYALRLDEARHPTTRLLADVRFATYGNRTAQTAWLGIAQALPSHLTVTVKGVATRNLSREWTQGWLTRLDYEPHDNLRWYVGYADARESLETTIVDLTRELRTRAVFVGVYYGFTPTLGARLDLAHEWTRTTPDRNGCHAGLVTRF
ncbi:MAG TPA: tetratricopeptide repeat protein [Opitutaceae bacterium]